MLAYARYQLWYAYLHAAECNKKAFRRKSVDLSDSSQPVCSGSLMIEGISRAETFFLASEGEPSAPPGNNLNAINDSEMQLPSSGEQPNAIINQENPELRETPKLSFLSS